MPNSLLGSPGLVDFAEALGEALGRGVARGINAGISGAGVSTAGQNGAIAQAPRRRGRPPKALGTAGKQQCTAAGCTNPARSKGLCSKHYQAARRQELRK